MSVREVYLGHLQTWLLQSLAEGCLSRSTEVQASSKQLHDSAKVETTERSEWLSGESQHCDNRMYLLHVAFTHLSMSFPLCSPPQSLAMKRQ